MVPDTPSLCTHTHLHLEDRVNLVAAQAVEQLTLDAARAVGAAAGRVGVIQHGLLVRRARLDVLSAGWPEAVEIGPCSWVVRAAHDAHELISAATPTKAAAVVLACPHQLVQAHCCCFDGTPLGGNGRQVPLHGCHL